MKYYGYYSEYKYEIVNLHDIDAEPYTAYNHSLDSQQSLPIDHPYACSLEQMKEYCDISGKEIAEKNNGVYLGSEYDETHAEFMKELHTQQSKFCKSKQKGVLK